MKIKHYIFFGKIYLIMNCPGGEVRGAGWKSPVPYCPEPVIPGSAVGLGGEGRGAGRKLEKRNMGKSNPSLVQKY